MEEQNQEEAKQPDTTTYFPQKPKNDDLSEKLEDYEKKYQQELEKEKYADEVHLAKTYLESFDKSTLSEYELGKLEVFKGLNPIEKAKRYKESAFKSQVEKMKENKTFNSRVESLIKSDRLAVQRFLADNEGIEEAYKVLERWKHEDATNQKIAVAKSINPSSGVQGAGIHLSKEL